jgi:WXG100 family type VII secretion target
MYRIDLAALAASATHVAGLGEDLASAHVASDNRIAAAQSGWVGASAVALNTKAAEWLQDSRRLLGRLGDHAMDLTNDGMCFAAAEHASAETLRALGQV